MTQNDSGRKNGHDGSEVEQRTRKALEEPLSVVALDGTPLDDETADPWNGPFDEYDKYGEPTGASYVRCRDCGVEVVTSIDTDTVGHRDGCRFD